MSLPLFFTTEKVPVFQRIRRSRHVIINALCNGSLPQNRAAHGDRAGPPVPFFGMCLWAST